MSFTEVRKAEEETHLKGKIRGSILDMLSLRCC